MFVVDRPFLRFLFFVFFMTIVGAVGVLHGVAGKTRTIQLIDDMLLSGKLTGSYWHVIGYRNGLLELTKYGYTVSLATADLQNVRQGDCVSFSAAGRKKSDGTLQWTAERIHVHGTSTFKYLISVLGIVWVCVMCFCYLSLEKTNWSLIFKENVKLCQTD